MGLSTEGAIHFDHTRLALTVVGCGGLLEWRQLPSYQVITPFR